MSEAAAERHKRSFDEIFGCDPVSENREKVLEKLYELGVLYEKNPCAETHRDYHDALDAAKAVKRTEKIAGEDGSETEISVRMFDNLPASAMHAAYDAQNPADRSPAGVPEKLQK